jgi:hypothetical protein
MAYSKAKLKKKKGVAIKHLLVLGHFGWENYPIHI